MFLPLFGEAVGYEHKDFLLAVGELDRLGGGVRRVGEVVADDNGMCTEGAAAMVTTHPPFNPTE
jgi:hypothetical protein